MPRLRDHERRPRTNEARTLAQDCLQPPRILAGRKLARLRRRLDFVEAHHPAFGLGDDLVRNDDHVSGLELRGGGDQSRDVVPLAHLRQPPDRDHA